MRILGFSSRDTIEEWSADIFVRNAGVVNTEADKNVRAPEKPKMRTDLQMTKETTRPVGTASLGWC